MNEKKLDKDTALAKVKILINKYYEDIGREIQEDADEEKRELIEKIDYILSKVDISQKHLIIERLDLDEKVKKELNNIMGVC